MMHAREWVPVSLLAALAASAVLGCAPPGGLRQTAEQAEAAHTYAVPPRYQITVREMLGEASLVVDLARVDAADEHGEAAEGRKGARQARTWRFCPGFLLLPLAPVQTGIGLGGATVLATAFASTYPLRLGAGTAGAGICAITGSRHTAGQLWEWAWDSSSHARFWGVHPDQGRSALEQCAAFAFDYSRYSLLPALPDRTAHETARSGTRVGTRPRVETGRVPCVIRELTAAVRASRPDAEILSFVAPLRRQGSGPVVLPIGSAIEAFCYDDELTLDLVAVPASDVSQRVSRAHTTQVKRWRDPAGPRIRWLEPRNVAPGGTAVNAVTTKELSVRVLLRADTPDAPITLWQIKQDGKVRGGAFAARGKADLGRAVVAGPEAKIEFRRPGDRTTLEVVAEAGQSYKASSTATFVFSPER